MEPRPKTSCFLVIYCRHSVSVQQSIDAQVNVTQCEAACKSLKEAPDLIDELSKLSLEQLR